MSKMGYQNDWQKLATLGSNPSGWAFSTFICCKNCLFQNTKNKRKRGRERRIKKVYKDYQFSHLMQGLIEANLVPSNTKWKTQKKEGRK